jgi:hypothetical protein
MTQSSENQGTLHHHRRLDRHGCGYGARARQAGLHVLAGVRRESDGDAIKGDFEAFILDHQT